MPKTLAGSGPHDEIDSATIAFYRQVLEALNRAGIPFLVGGAFAFAHLTGIQRHTKDLDLFIRRDDYPRIESLLRGHGHRIELTFPHWLAKVHAGDDFIDLIFDSGNGLAPVDDAWFQHADDAEVFGVPVKLSPAEESLWTKAFIMERERFDGADVAHFIRACAHRLDWERLVRRFGPHWRVLLSHLVLFGFIYPGDRALLPPWVMDDLLARLWQETQQPPPHTRLCAGTLLSREQYLADIEQFGYRDARVTTLSTMSAQDVSAWTEAIPSRQDATQPGG